MVKGPLQHLLRELRLGRKEALGGNACALAARYVVSPFFGEIDLTIEQDMAMGTRIGQKHPNLAIVHATGCPAILACVAGGLWRTSVAEAAAGALLVAPLSDASPASALIRLEPQSLVFTAAAGIARPIPAR
jgi:hypothetical protein